MKKPGQPPAQPQAVSSPEDSFLAVYPLTCFFPGRKALCRVRLLPETDDFVHQKKAVFKAYRVCFCQHLDFSTKKTPIRAFTWVQVKPLQLQGGSACSGIAGISQLPVPAGALAAGSTTHIKTSKHRLYVTTSGFSRATRPAPAADTVRKSPSPALGTAATGETETGTSELTFTQGFEHSLPIQELQTPKGLEIHERDGFWSSFPPTHPKGSSHSPWMQFQFKHTISD